ncbi:carboxymuconolactone decarboxylase family protein [Rhodobacteraceae bacterium B1Z28]|uniref:Carboxymuconolactone decarboxylase family protein n=1 Tax=Ruegeria haliotis TaxID=2747601 RepID=A0ABX2PMC7_9RHOB|nr:carboxymuconolactone decarboxylase family protein [Ruegeria haliotis]NVO55188.1 carboxymuconolactone decarboxylase family protein [Ruegeria haliotis]
MTRIPPLTDQDMSKAAHASRIALAEYGPFDNWARLAAYSPPVLEHVTGMLTELRAQDNLPRRALELAMVTVSKLNACDYCVSHHTPLLTVAGLSPEGAARLPNVEDHPELDDCDKAVVRYAEAVTTRSGRMRDAEVSGLRDWFSDAQIVELTWRIALCGAFNRFNDALQIQIESDLAPVSA